MQGKGQGKAKLSGRLSSPLDGPLRTRPRLPTATDRAIAAQTGGVVAVFITCRDHDDSQTGVNIRVFPALLQDRREVPTATGTSGSPNGGRGADLAIFPGIWTHSSRRLLLNA